MNIIFLDFDGVLYTLHNNNSEEDIRKRIKILADICKKTNSKIVIEASAKDAIDEATMTTKSEWIKNLFTLFKEYGIECIGRTPNVRIKKSDSSYISMWKEDEIRLYLFRHPEVEHYCIIDDDDLSDMKRKSDLDKVRDHLVKTIYYSDDEKKEGLLENHKEEVAKVLKKENDIKKYALKRKKSID